MVAALLLPEASTDWLLACCALEDELELTYVLALELEPEEVLAFEFELELGSELVLVIVRPISNHPFRQVPYRTRD